MRVAALDLGSNTSLLMIADVERGRPLQVRYDQTTITRLGQGVHAQREFHPEALRRMDKCLAEYSATIKKWSCERVIAVATSAARDVRNGDELLALGQKYAIPIHIISGPREAELTFRGALGDRTDTDGVVVIDVGGGSTELIAPVQGVPQGTSVDVGSVRLTELLVHTDPISVDDLSALRAYAQKAFAHAPLPKGVFQEVIAVAGTPTTLATLDMAMPFEESRVQGYPLSLTKMEEWLTRLAALPIAERERLPGMQPKRADVLVAGAVILTSALQALNQSQVTVSTRGVRYGVALAWEDF